MKRKWSKETKLKIERFKHELKVTFFSISYAYRPLSEEIENLEKNRWRKQSYLTTSRKDIRET